MGITFYIDPEIELPHIYKHNVNDDEVKEVIFHSGEDRPGYKGARVAIGQTNNGRYLKVIYAQDKNSNNIFVITAYELKGNALLAYKRRRKRKGKK